MDIQEKMSGLKHMRELMTIKYEILLKFVNKLLENMKMSQISDLSEFKHVKREDLLSEENNQIYEEMKEEIHKYYNKINQRESIKNYLLSVLKSMCSEMFMKFESETVRKKINGKSIYYITYGITTVDCL